MTKEERIYYKLKLIREVENAIIQEYPSDEIKTPCHLAIGAEAIATGVSESFPGSKVFASYRSHHWYLAFGGSLDAFFLELFGKRNEIADGKAGSMHLSCPEQGLVLTSAVVASQIAPACGYAFAQKYWGKDQLTICALGDGATEEGVFYECLNIAKLHQLKILFVVEDNGLAIHQTKERRQAFDLEQLAFAYGIPYFDANGANISEIMACLELRHKFPQIAHLRYHRFKEHVGINDDYGAGYRDKPADLQKHDPLYRYEIFVPYDKRKEIDARVKLEIDQAIEKAKAAPFAPKESLLEHVWAS